MKINHVNFINEKNDTTDVIKVDMMLYRKNVCFPYKTADWSLNNRFYLSFF